jgi:hypothetical protein
LTVDRRARVHEYLARTRAADPIAHAIADLLRTVDATPAAPPSALQRLHARLHAGFASLVRHRSCQIALELFLAGQVVVGVVNALTVAWPALAGGERSGAVSFADLGRIGCSAISALFVIAGMLTLRRSRLQAYQHFRTAVLISILLTEFFVFLQAQFAALPGFALNLAILLVLGELIDQERALAAGVTGRALPSPAGSPRVAGPRPEPAHWDGADSAIPVEPPERLR